MIIDLATAKQQLNITDEVDDDLITRKILAAESRINRLLGFQMATGFEPGEVPADLQEAILMLVAHWYENREDALIGLSAAALPHGVNAIVQEYREWSF